MSKLDNILSLFKEPDKVKSTSKIYEQSGTKDIKQKTTTGSLDKLRYTVKTNILPTYGSQKRNKNEDEVTAHTSKNLDISKPKILKYTHIPKIKNVDVKKQHSVNISRYIGMERAGGKGTDFRENQILKLEELKIAKMVKG